MREKPSWTEYIQPALMGAASLMSVITSGIAIYVGADKTMDGRTNPFFYAAMSNSFIYTGANIYKCGQIYNARCQTFAESEQIRGELTELIVR